MRKRNSNYSTQSFNKHFHLFLAVSLGLSLLFAPRLNAQNGSFSMEDVKSYPFPSNLSTSSATDHIAWTFNESGLRNLYVAAGPEYKVRKLTTYEEDDAQAISHVSISSDGKWVVYIRGGDYGSNWSSASSVNPGSLPQAPKTQMWSISFEGGEPILLGDGASLTISPQSDYIAFVRSGQLWKARIDGSEKAEPLFSARGSNGSPVWSPDANKIAFRSSRQDHSFIGVYNLQNKSITWMDPSFDKDNSPRWSPDGKQIVFIRQPGSGGKVRPVLEKRHSPWEIRVANYEDASSEKIWEAPKTLRGSAPHTQGGTNLHWAAKGRIVFLSYQDGWPHLYSISANGGKALLLTPGNYMAEYIHLSSDGKWLVFAGNTGSDPLDIDRRHIVRVPVDKADAEVMTPGSGLEWTPVITGKSGDLVFLSATPERPPLPAVMNQKSRQITLLAEDHIPINFPLNKLVTPKQVIFPSEDGLNIHGTLFEPEGMSGKNPVVIFLHGGPPRQMLLGWHYSSYYSNAYAINQYLVNQGFVVLSVNYRLGIGYGYEFHNPEDAGSRGASEYRDVKAAALWLAQQDFVNPKKIGVYGGSYGGYLTAMALGRNSDLFAAGVDISGVHDRTIGNTSYYLWPNQYEKAPDNEKAIRIAWASSPVSTVSGWTSPVLIIHGDDDRNVRVSQSTDLVQRLREKGVYTETLMIVDDTHHFMMHKNQLRVNEATAEFLHRQLMEKKE